MKKIDAEKQPGLAALKKKRPDVTKKMGFMKKGGSPKKMMGGGMMGYMAGGSPKVEKGIEVIKMPQEIPTPKPGQPLTVAAKGHKGYSKKVTITQEDNMKLIKDVIEWLKEWNDWNMKDWIKAGIICGVVLMILGSI